MKGIPWSLDEMARLRRLRCVEARGYDTIAGLMGRTRRSVVSKLGQMGWRLPRERYLEIKRAVVRDNARRRCPAAPWSPAQTDVWRATADIVRCAAEAVATEPRVSASAAGQAIPVVSSLTAGRRCERTGGRQFAGSRTVRA